MPGNLSGRTDGRTCHKTVTVGRVDQRTHVQVKRGYFGLRTDGRTDGQPENIMPLAPQGGGMKISLLWNNVCNDVMFRLVNYRSWWCIQLDCLLVENIDNLNIYPCNQQSFECVTKISSWVVDVAFKFKVISYYMYLSKDIGPQWFGATHTHTGKPIDTHKGTDKLSWTRRGLNSAPPDWGNTTSCQLSSTFVSCHWNCAVNKN